MAVTIVRETVYTNPLNIGHDTFSLSAPATPGNTLIVVAMAFIGVTFWDTPEFIQTDTDGLLTEVPFWTLNPLPGAHWDFGNWFIASGGRSSVAADVLYVKTNGATSITFRCASSPKIWVYEVSGLATPTVDFFALAGSNGANKAPVISPALAGSGNPDFCVAITPTANNSYSSVPAPWTLDSTIQLGNAPAYLIGPGTESPIIYGGPNDDFTSAIVAFVGTPGQSRIIVNKSTNPPSATQGFIFHPSWAGGTPFILTNGQSNDSGVIPPGTYSLTEDPVTGWSMSASVSNGSPLNAISVSPGETVVINVLNTQAVPVSPCAPTDGSGNPVNGVFVPDIGLFIIPATALYNDLIPNAALKSSESTAEGRHSIIVDMNNNEGVYARDLGTIFTWDLQADTILDVWQPSIIPLDGEVYDRLSFHCLMTSLNNVGWQHAREMNISHASQADLTLLLTFDQWPNIVLTIPNSVGKEIKQKVTLPPNKFKLVEIFLSSALPFKLWASDLEMKIGQWGRSDAYRVLKPVSA